MSRLIISIAIFLIAITLTQSSRVRKFRNSVLTIKNKYEVDIVSNDKDEVNFMVIGDWGGLPIFPFRTLIENSVSSQMTSLAKTYNTQFQLALGDNFYFKGVTDENDPRFKSTFEDVFQSEPLVNTPWLTIMGNHDHYGNASAQVAYTDKYKRWIMPSFNYTVNIKRSDTDNSTFIRMLMIDTVSMCGNTGFDSEVFRKPKFSSTRDRLASREYFESIEDELEKLKYEYVPYVIINGHFPIWSIAEHGPTQCLVNRLRPLLYKYNVTAYFCGHDHSLQHLTETSLGQTVEYFVIGASNFVQNSTDHKDSVPSGSLKFFWAYGDSIINGGLGLVRANAQNMTFSFAETNGHDLYEKVIYPRYKNV